MRASGPRSQGSFPGTFQPGAGLGRPGNKASRRFSPGPRAAGPPSAPPGAVPGDAGQRPALPGVVPGNFPNRAGPRTRWEQGIASVLTGTAGRWPAFRAARRGPRGCGPAARAPRGRSRKLSKPGRGSDALGTRHRVHSHRDRGPLARIPRRQARSPGMRASGPRSQGSFPETFQTGPGLGRAGNKASRPFSPGPRAAGPHPAPPGAVPGDAGQRPAVPGSFLSRPAFRSPPTASWGCAAPDRRARR